MSNDTHARAEYVRDRHGLRTLNKVSSAEPFHIPFSQRATAWVYSIDLQTACDNHNQL